MLPPFGGETIEVGDLVIVVGSPHAARAWSEIMAGGGKRRVDDAVIVGARRERGRDRARAGDQELDVRMIEADPLQAREVAELLHDVGVLNASPLDGDFLERERIGHAKLAVFALRDEHANLYAAVLAKRRGVEFTIAIVPDAHAVDVFTAAGIDVAISPRSLVAEEIVRFAHDPRTQQVTMLEGDRFEILDVTCRTESALVGKPLRELPVTGSFVGAIVRDGKAIIPHGKDVLRPGDRAILFTESRRAAEVERAL